MVPVQKKQKGLDMSPKSETSSSKATTSTQIALPNDGKYVTNCAHCENEHHVLQCAQFKTPIYNARRKTIQRAKLCWNCLMPGHITKDCVAPPCSKCSGMHNIVMCQIIEKEQFK